MKKLLFLKILAVILLWSDYSSIYAGDIKSAAKDTLKKYEKAIIPVKIVLKFKAAGKDSERKLESRGTVIDPSGLTFVAGQEVDPTKSMKAVLGSKWESMKMDVEVSETSLLLEDGTEIEADVVLKDTELDFAFIRPRNTTRTFDYIPLKSRGTPPQLLEDIFVFSRLGISDRRNPYLNLGIIRSTISGPRNYYLCSENVTGGSMGCIVFDSNGAPIGVVVTKQSENTSGSMMPVYIMRPLEDLLDVVEQAKAAKLPEKTTSPSSLSAPPSSGDASGDKTSPTP
jgi:hypothetical protein